MIKKIEYLVFFLIIIIVRISFADNNALTIEVHIKDHKFIPEVIELPPNRKILLIVHNDDPTIEEFESFDLKREKIVLGNSSIKVILAPLTHGEYKFFGDFHQETAQGKIVVMEDK